MTTPNPSPRLSQAALHTEHVCGAMSRAAYDDIFSYEALLPRATRRYELQPLLAERFRWRYSSEQMVPFSPLVLDRQLWWPVQRRYGCHDEGYV